MNKDFFEQDRQEFGAVLSFVASYIKDNGKYNKDLYYRAADTLHLYFGERFLKPYYNLAADCSRQQLHDIIVEDLAKQIYVGLWELR